ncbi:MAG: hypothetical protein LBT27_00350 [Prevotellaceae bacterium]|jgi:hypothetical protein|nr:hypothetical protein [Prevotellaceae bacterium]
MATITLHYDARDPNVSMLINSIVNLGLATIATPETKKTGIELALEDIEEGRVYTAFVPKDKIEE